MEFSVKDIGHKIEEVYAMMYCGARKSEDGMHVDGALIRDLTNFDDIATNCFCAVEPDGTAHAREVYDGKDFITDENFDSTLKRIAEKYRGDCYLTVLDLHD